MASKHGVDPRLVAAIISVANREHASAFEHAAEAVLAGAWATNGERIRPSASRT